MKRCEYFRLGLEYLISLEDVDPSKGERRDKKGTKARISRCAGIDQSNFNAMLKGRRPFPEIKRGLIARCMGLGERDLERLGMDLHAGLTETIHFQKVLARKILFPEPSEEADLDVFAWDPVTMKLELIGEAWSVEKADIIAQFERVPEYQVRYVFRPKVKVEAPPPPDGGRAEDE